MTECRGPASAAAAGRGRVVPLGRRAGSALADPYPPDDPVPGAFMLYLPADGMTIWYVVTPDEGTEVITDLIVRGDT